jgi:NADH:ubiquinone oxidoreductase subunit 3 (subunit A)
LAILALFSAFTDAFQLFKDIEIFRLFDINPMGEELLLIKHVYFIVLLLLIVVCVFFKIKKSLVRWIKNIWYK